MITKEDFQPELAQAALAQAALAFAAKGFFVFPLQPRSKEPYPGTRGLLDASMDPEQIRKWWAIAPDSNVGVRPPPGVVVVDVDPRNRGHVSIAALEAQNGALPNTLTVKTGGGGLHAYYSAPAELAWPKELAEGIDLKAHNGYLLGPPSVHDLTGQPYVWLSPPDTPIAQAPAWLVAKGYQRTERVTVVDEDDAPALPSAEVEVMAARLAPMFASGKKHGIAFAVGGWLRQRGWNQGDIAAVVSRLPSTNPRARVKDALDGFRAQTDHGWSTLRGLVGEANAAQLDAATPNPRREAKRREHEEAAEILLPAMAAAVAQQVQVPAYAQPPGALPLPQAAGVPPLPTWYQPAELLENPPPLDYVIPELEFAAGGRVNMIVGYSNVGKSIIAQALAFSIATGALAWGRFAVRRKRVLYLDGENIHVSLENFSRLAKAAGVPMTELRQWLTVVDSSFYIDGPNAEYELATVIQRQGYGAFFLDTFRAAAPTLKENDREVSVPLYMLGRVSKGTGTLGTILHHENKPQQGKRGAAEYMIAGHASIHGALGVSITLVGDAETKQISAYCSKKIRRGFEPFNLQIVDVGASSAADAIAAGTSSPGVRVEYVSETPKLKPINEDTLAGALTRILAWLHANAKDGREVRADRIMRPVDFGGIGGRKQTNTAAFERLESDGQITYGGSPKMVSLIVDAPPYDPKSVAPPALAADMPPLAHSQDELAAALRAQQEEQDE